MHNQPWTPQFDEFLSHVFLGRTEDENRLNKFHADQQLHRFRHDPVCCAEYLIRLFENAPSLLASRTDEELDEGFGYIESKLMETALREVVPRPTHERFLRSVLPLVR